MKNIKCVRRHNIVCDGYAQWCCLRCMPMCMRTIAVNRYCDYACLAKSFYSITYVFNIFMTGQRHGSVTPILFVDVTTHIWKRVVLRYAFEFIENRKSDEYNNDVPTIDDDECSINVTVWNAIHIRIVNKTLCMMANVIDVLDKKMKRIDISRLNNTVKFSPSCHSLYLITHKCDSSGVIVS